MASYLSIVEGGIEGLLLEATFNQTEGEYGVTPIFFPIEASPGCQKWLGAEPAREGHYLNPETISEMCRLLKGCTESCHPWEAPSFLPTRLVDVGAVPSDIPHLVLSSDICITEHTKYAALSYCWGSEEDAKTQLKTESLSITRRCQGIPYEMMTPAIEDAVVLTRAVGLRYVWVDALCIVQDDAADWSRESSQMNRVYCHAFVTFCGLNSASCHESLLQRAPAVRVPFQSCVRPTANGYYLIRLRPRFGDWLNREKRAWDLATSRWDRRGWTYQEQELSTRLLLFGGLKMHFECGKCEWSEGDDEVTRLDTSRIRIRDRIKGIQRGELPARTLYDNWVRIVHLYGNRLVTHDKDRLPAISGLARIVWEMLRDQYLGGVWKGDLLRGLDWISSDESALRGLQNHLQNLREREYIAPSWSWAGCAGCVSMCNPVEWRTVSEATVVEASVETELQNPFGQVFGGFLRICGDVAPIPSHLPLERQDRWSRTWRHDLDRVEPDAGIMAWLDWFQKGEEDGLENLIMLLLLRYQEDPTRPGSPQQNQAEPVVVREQGEAPELRALILHPANGPGRYYRVGAIHSYKRAGYDLLRIWFEGSRKETVCIF